LVLCATDDGVAAIDDSGHHRRELDGAASRLTRSAGECWAVVDRFRVMRRAADGQWSTVADADAALTCAVGTNGTVLAGTTDGALLRLDGDALAPLDGFDRIDGRDHWHAVGSSKPYVRSLSLTADARALLANVHVGGIPRSTDEGRTWVPTIDPDADVHEVRAHPADPAVAAAAAAVGFASSRDGGVTWTVQSAGLHSSYARAVAFCGDGALLSASDGPFATRGAVYRQPLDDGPAQRCADGLPEWLAGNIDTGCLDGHGDSAVLADGDGAVFASADAGMTWHHHTDVPRPVHSVVILPG
jgi:hypothetical protein